MNDSTEAFKRITVQELSKVINSKVAHRLVDVREAEEYNFCRLPNAVLCSLSNFESSFSLQNIGKEETIFLYCHHGKRSAMAAELLTAMGYKDVSSIEGGIEAWSTFIDSTVPRY